MTTKQYARRRGVTVQAVQKALGRGRISALPDGRIDPVTADREWSENTRRRVDFAARGGGEIDPIYVAARARSTLFQAKLRQLQSEREAGLLVPIADVRAQFYQARKQIEGRLGRLAEVIAARVAPLTDPEACRLAIREEVQLALRGLAELREEDHRVP